MSKTPIMSKTPTPTPTPTPITDTATDVETTKKPKRLNAKLVRRRMGKVMASSEPKLQRKKKGKLAIAILSRIASGEIKNPKAVALAFAAGEADAAKTEDAPETAV